MQGTKIAKAWFALIALVGLTGLVAQVIATASSTTGQFQTLAGRIANLFTYFTIDSNVLVTAVAALFALGLSRANGLFPVLWLDALVGITVTGIVYKVALAGLVELHGLMLFADIVLHTVTPILFVFGWLLLAPRGTLTWRTIRWSLLFPLIWLAFTLPRGAITGYYPYPFLNADKLGYGTVTLNCLGVAVLFIGLAAAAMVLDRVYARRDHRELNV